MQSFSTANTAFSLPIDFLFIPLLLRPFSRCEHLRLMSLRITKLAQHIGGYVKLPWWRWSSAVGHVNKGEMKIWTSSVCGQHHCTSLKLGAVSGDSAEQRLRFGFSVQVKSVHLIYMTENIELNPIQSNSNCIIRIYKSQFENSNISRSNVWTCRVLAFKYGTLHLCNCHTICSQRQTNDLIQEKAVIQRLEFARLWFSGGVGRWTNMYRNGYVWFDCVSTHIPVQGMEISAVIKS